MHERLTNVLVALVDDLNFDLLTQSDDAIKQSSKVIKGLVTNQIAGLRNALDIAAQTHLVASVLSESAVAKDAATLAPFQDRFKASSDSLANLSETLRDEQIKQALSELLAFGQGDASVSALRGKELAATLRADATIEENTRIQRELDQAVSNLVTEIEGRMHRNIGQLTDKLDQDRILLIIAAVLSLLASGTIAVLYVQRNLVRRLCAIRDAMRRLSAGDTALDMPAAEDRDEIGEMARAVRIFRDGAVARERLEGEAAEQRRSHADTQEKVAQEQRRGMEEQRRSAQEQADGVRALKAGLGKLSGGDLTFRLSEEFPPAYREIKDEFNLRCRARETSGAGGIDPGVSARQPRFRPAPRICRSAPRSRPRRSSRPRPRSRRFLRSRARPRKTPSTPAPAPARRVPAPTATGRWSPRRSPPWPGSRRRPTRSRTSSA